MQLLKWARDRKRDAGRAVDVVSRGASRTLDQANVFDNGRTWQNRQPVNTRSVIGQATHNGATNVIGGGVVKPLIRTSMAINQGIGNAQLAIAGRPTLSAEEFNAVSPGLNQFAGYTGTKKQIAGDAITNVANITIPGSSKVVKGAFNAVMPRVVPNVVNRTLANAGVGTAAGAVGATGQGYGEEQIKTIEDLKRTAIQGAQFGALLGAGGTLALPVVKAGANKVAPTVKTTSKAVKEIPARQSQKVTNAIIERDPELVVRTQQTRPQLQQEWEKATPQTRKQIDKAIAENEKAIADRIKKTKEGGYIAFHGANKEFDKFDPELLKVGTYGKAAYLTDDPKVASYYGDKKLNFDVPDDIKLYTPEGRAQAQADFETAKRLYKESTGKDLSISRSGFSEGATEADIFWRTSKTLAKFFPETAVAKQLWVDDLKRQGYQGVKAGDTQAIFDPTVLKRVADKRPLLTPLNQRGSISLGGANATPNNGRIVSVPKVSAVGSSEGSIAPTVRALLDERAQAMKAGQSEYVYATEQKLKVLGYDVDAAQKVKATPERVANIAASNEPSTPIIPQITQEILGKRIRANDRGNIGTVVSQNADGSAQVRFTNRKDKTTFTKTMTPEEFTVLGRTSGAAKNLRKPGAPGKQIPLKSPTVNGLSTLPSQEVIPTPPQIRGPQILIDQLQRAGTASINNTPVSGNLQAVAVPSKVSKYAAKTVPKSNVVTEDLAKGVQKNAPEYQVQSDKGRLASANERINAEGPENFIKGLDQRLDVENGKISSQDVTDTQSIAAMLDAAGDADSLLKATQLYDRLSEHLTAAGQTVQAASLIANRSPQGLKFQAQRTFSKAGVKLTPEKIAELNKYIDAVRKAKPNTEAMAIARDNVQYFIAKNTPTNTADKVVNFWRSGLLTAPTTTGGALAGNAFATIQRKLWTNPIATMTDMVFSLGTGKRTRALAAPGSFAGGAKRGLNNVRPTKGSQFWKTGYDPMNPIANEQTVGTNSRRVNYGDGRLGRAAGTYVNGVYKLMGAADQPFRYGAYDEVMSSLARSEAINRGLKGEARDKFVKDFIANPPESAAQRATDEAMDATFQDKTQLAGLVQGMKQGAKQRGYHKTAALIDFLIPFSGVPSSIASRVIRNTPIGTANQLVKQLYNISKGEAFDQRLMSQAIAEGTIGLPIVAAGYALAKSDNFNGGYPTDPKERQKWTDENRQENSVRIGDRWYSLNYIQPFGTLLSVGAGIAQTEGEDGQNPSLDDYLATSARSGIKSFTGQSYLEGIQGPLDAINDPEANAAKYVASAVSGVTPNFIRSAVRASDSVQRDASGWEGGLKGTLPGLRQTLPAKVGSDGKPLPNKDNFVNMYVNPLKPSIARDSDPVVKETSRLLGNDLGVTASPVKKIEFGDKTIKLDKKEQEAYNTRLGKLRSENWSRLINSAAYKTLDDAGKQKALQDVASDVRAVVKREYAAKNNVGPYAQDFTGKDKPLTVKQQAIASGKQDISKYTKSSTGGGTTTSVSEKITPHSKKVLDEYNSLDAATRKSKIDKEPSYEWKVEKSKLENDIAEGKVSNKQLLEREKKVAKLDLTKTYSKEAREVYTMSDDRIEEYLDKFGTDKLAEELLAIDQLEVDQGWRKKRKLYGTSAGSGKGKGGKAKKTARSSGKAAKARKEAKIPFELLKGAAITPSIGRARQAQIRAKTPGRPSFKAKTSNTKRATPKAAKYQGTKQR